MLCLILTSLFSIAFNIQSARACQYPPGYIPVGEDVTVFPDPNVGLVFELVTVAGWATATETTRYPPLPPCQCDEVSTMSDLLPPSGFLEPVWVIEVTATFSGKVIVAIDYGETEIVPTHLLQTDIILGDVNADGKVNFRDICLIIRALWSSPESPRWNPYCDLNGDGKINLRDICIAIQHFGQTSVWLDRTTYVDTQAHIIYGETDSFSIFGITRRE